MKKFIAIILSLTMLTAAVSCGETKEKDNSNELFNDNNNVLTEDGYILLNTIFRFDELEEEFLCNIPNCSHITSRCLAESIQDITPIIYNNCAYYFINHSDFKEIDGKSDVHLETYVMKYDFSKMEISRIASYVGGNANPSGYLVDSEYYFTVNNGDPEYDEAGNIKTSSNGGAATMLSINLDTAEITEYGEVFDWEYYKKKYHSIHTLIIGKYNDEIYLKTGLGNGMVFSDIITAFNIKTHEFREYADKVVEDMNEQYIAYLSTNGNFSSSDVGLDYQTCDYDFHIENLETGEVIEIKDVTYSYVKIYDDRVWYDNKCYDIKTGKIAVISDSLINTPLGIYENKYVIKEYGEDAIEYRYLSEDELERLFEEQEK